MKNQKKNRFSAEFFSACWLFYWPSESHSAFTSATTTTQT